MSKKLFEAIVNNNIENVRIYIEQGLDFNKQCYSEIYGERMCPLALACCHGHEEIIEVLLQAGADPNQVSGWPSQPVMLMSAERRVLTLSMMRCLISYGVDVDITDFVGQTILHYLARGQFKDADDNLFSAAKLVLDNGASVNVRDMLDYTPLYEACRCSNIDLVKLYIDEGADMNFDIGHKTMLRGAADDCNIDMFDLLLNAGCNRHLTPAALVKPCSWNDHAMIANILDTCNVDINMVLRGCGGMSILQYACDDLDITSTTVQLLLDRGADVKAVSDSGDTVLHYAVKHCDWNKILQLLSYNPPLNTENNKNQTPLVRLKHCISSNNSPSLLAETYPVIALIFNILIIAGANITVDVENELYQLRIKHPEAGIPQYEINLTRSLKEMCRFLIRGTIPVPVNVSLCRLPIPKLLQEYLNFPEFNPLIGEYLSLTNDDAAATSMTTVAVSNSTTTGAGTSTINDATVATLDVITRSAEGASDNNDDEKINGKDKSNNERTTKSMTTKLKGRKTKCVLY